MAITKRVSGALATAAAAIALIGLSATPAMASTTLTATVKGGGSITAVASKTVLSNGTGAKKVSVTCATKGKTDASKASGSITNGTHKGASPLAVGTTTALSFGNCTGPVGTVTTKVETSKFKISVDSKTTGSGDTDGIVGPVTVKVSMTGCSFIVKGSAPGYYDNANHTLHVTASLPTKALSSAQLTVSGVSGCFGLVANGDHPSYTSTYTVSRKITIKVTT